MSRAYDFRQKKAINYNEKLSNRTNSNSSSSRKSRGRKSEASSIPSNSRSLRRRKTVNHTYEEDEDDSPESSQAPILGHSEPIMLDSTSNLSPDPNLTAFRPVLEDLSPPILTRECNNYSEHGEQEEGNQHRLRRKKAVNYSYVDDVDESLESSQAPILGQSEPIMLNFSRNLSPDNSLTAQFKVFEDMSPPILTREVNNNMQEKDDDYRVYSPPPQLEPMEQMALEDTPVSDGSGVNQFFEIRPIVTLSELLEQRAKSAEKVLTEASPSLNPSEKSSGNPPNSSECEICGNQASRVHYDLHTCESCSVEFFSSYFDDPRNSYHVEDLTSPNLSPIMSETSENLSNSSQCQVCGNQASGVHFGVETCESCSTFFQQKVTELPDYNCYCNRVWKHTFDINVSCHCCRFQKCLDVGMKIPPDSMFSRITPHSENLGLCRVCWDIGTSHCKGVVTCSSCTFFLYRSTRTPFDGECDKNCLINPSTRDCPACRFQKFREAESQISKDGLEETELLGPSPSVQCFYQEVAGFC
ncbi:unnamed protein product [Caenorhabditis brenneri]